MQEKCGICGNCCFSLLEVRFVLQDFAYTGVVRLGASRVTLFPALHSSPVMPGFGCGLRNHQISNQDSALSALRLVSYEERLTLGRHVGPRQRDGFRLL